MDGCKQEKLVCAKAMINYFLELFKREKNETLKH